MASHERATDAAERARLTKILGDHLERVGGTKPCPICSTNDWVFAGIAKIDEGRITVDRATTDDTGDVVPAALIVCKNCHFMQHFAWLPILAKSNG